MATTGLEKERDYFNAHRQEFLAKAPGKFAVIKGETCFGFFDSEQEAYSIAMQEIGLEPFLIQKVTIEDDVYENPAFFLDLIYASA